MIKTALNNNQFKSWQPKKTMPLVKLGRIKQLGLISATISGKSSEWGRLDGRRGGDLASHPPLQPKAW